MPSSDRSSKARHRTGTERPTALDLGPAAYFRLRRGYRTSALRTWIAEVRSAAASHDEVHVYFKHDPDAPGLAQRLLRSVNQPRR